MVKAEFSWPEHGDSLQNKDTGVTRHLPNFVGSTRPPRKADRRVRGGFAQGTWDMCPFWWWLSHKTLVNKNRTTSRREPYSV